VKVLINGLTLKVGGARTVLVGTLKALARYAPEHEYLVYASTRLDPPMPPLPPNFEIRHLPRVERSGALVFLWEQLELPRIARRERVDAMYSMCSGHGPALPGVRQVLALHNPTWFVGREEGIPGLPRPGAAARRALARLAVAGSDRVLVQTRAMAARVVKFIPEAAAKIVVSPQGAPEFEEVPRLEADRRTLRERLDRFRERREFVVLSAGFYERHKDLETLLDAFEIASRKDARLGLVLTLDPAWCPEARALAARAESPGLRERVLLTGAVPHALMPEVYGAADLFCFPSLLESFGLPMVEAMSFGLPILAADTPVNREVCREAAVYHRSFDASDLAGSLVTLAGNAVTRDNLAARARERARAFNSEAHALALVTSLGIPSA